MVRASVGALNLWCPIPPKTQPEYNQYPQSSSDTYSPSTETTTENDSTTDTEEHEDTPSISIAAIAAKLKASIEIQKQMYIDDYYLQTLAQKTYDTDDPADYIIRTKKRISRRVDRRHEEFLKFQSKNNKKSKSTKKKRRPNQSILWQNQSEDLTDYPQTQYIVPN